MIKINKIIYIILLILVFLFLSLILFDYLKEKNYVKEFKFNNKIAIVNLYSNQNVDNVFTEIDKMYKNNKDIKEEEINNKIVTYLKSTKINKYTINTNNIIQTSNHNFKIGLPDPDDDYNILKVINVKNNCIASINVKKNSIKSITVISNDNCQNIALKIGDMDINEGLDYINNLTDADAIWYTFDKKFVKSNNFKKYE